MVPDRTYSPPRPGHSLLKAKWAPHLGHEERGFLMHIFLLRASLDGSLCQAHNQPLQVGPRWQFDGFKIYFPIKLYYAWLTVSLSVSFKKHMAQFALKWKRKIAIGCLTCTVKDLGQVNNDITMGDASGWDGRQIRPVSYFGFSKLSFTSFTNRLSRTFFTIQQHIKSLKRQWRLPK